MSKAGLDNRHRNKDGDISGNHGNTLIRTLRKIYGQSFAAGYPDTEKLREVLLKLNETSLSPLVNMIGFAAPRIIGNWQRGHSTAGCSGN